MEDVVKVIKSAPNGLSWPRFTSWYSKNRKNKKATNSQAWKLYNTFQADIPVETDQTNDEVEGSDIEEEKKTNKRKVSSKSRSKKNKEDSDREDTNSDNDEQSSDDTQLSQKENTEDEKEQEEQKEDTKKISHIYHFNLLDENNDNIEENLSPDEFRQVKDSIEESTAIAGVLISSFSYKYPNHFSFILASKTKQPIEKPEVQLPESCTINVNSGKKTTFNIQMI